MRNKLGRKTPKPLLDKLDEINATRRANNLKPWSTSQAIHGHHIVMKGASDPWSIASRKMLEQADIKVLYTLKELNKAGVDELDNLAFAISNGYRGIHTEKYAKAVWQRLRQARHRGKGNPDRIRQLLVDELAKMRRILELGDIFW